jgi:hypothetical protein
MKLRNALLLMITFLRISSSVYGEEKKKAFLEYKCEMTLPDADWQWIDITTLPKSMENAVFLLVCKDNRRITMTARPLSPGETFKANSFASFEYGLFESGRLSKVTSRELKFTGIPAFEILANTKSGDGVYSRIFFANGYLFQFTIATPERPADPKVDQESLFNSLKFLGEPELPPVETASAGVEQARKDGESSAPFLSFLCVGGLVAGIVLLCFFAIRKSNRNYSNDDTIKDDLDR